VKGDREIDISDSYNKYLGLKNSKHVQSLYYSKRDLFDNFFLHLKFREMKTYHALKLNQQTEEDKQITFFEHTSNKKPFFLF
jgi:hypothetical protein